MPASPALPFPAASFRRAFSLLLVCCWSFVFGIPFAKAQTDSPDVRVMSFNIRLGVAKDGPNEWEKRKEIVVKTIEQFDPDLLGTQETWRFQAEYLAEKLPGYTYVGRSRQRDGKGEECGILFRTERFDKLIEGHFWLSEAMDEPGSKSWDSSIPRMVTWLQLWDRKNESSFYILNTHFDHKGVVARFESAKLIRGFVEYLPDGADVIVTGDFNAGENSKPYQALFGSGDTLVDTFRKVHPEPADREGTFNGFKGKDDGNRIDWIASSPKWKVRSATIDKTSFDGRYPSDHFPVTAVLMFSDSVK